MVRCDRCGCVISYAGFEHNGEHFCEECMEKRLELPKVWNDRDNVFEFRICDHCGRPMFDGMTDLESFYTHDANRCFLPEFERRFGKDMRVVEESGENDGYYMAKDERGEWYDTGIFYTDWS